MAAAAQVIQSAAAARSLLHGERLRILEQLATPDSAAGIGRRLNLPRQKVNYHLRALEKHGFVALAEERRKGNCLERVMRATARSYFISPAALGALGMGEPETRDRFSSAYLLWSAARVLREVALLRGRAERAAKSLATLTLETEIRFATAAARLHFSQELVEAVAALVTKYHNERAGGGRVFRVLLGAYPAVAQAETGETASVNFE
jgi:DNA-binding transcriptional ArsR family regulator